MIFIASDHGGFNLKNELIKHFQAVQTEITDLGPFKIDYEDDFPDFAYPLASRVAQNPIDDKGILICRNGVGVSMLANKVKGIRSVLSWDPKHAASSKNDDNTNVLALPADYIDLETAKLIAGTWLKTPFSNELKFKRRLEKVAKIEDQLNK